MKEKCNKIKEMEKVLFYKQILDGTKDILAKISNKVMVSKFTTTKLHIKENSSMD